VLASTVEAIVEALEQSTEILVIAHVGPDGDAASSLSATGLVLQRLGKSFTLACDSAIPARFKFLPLYERLQRKPDDALTYDLVIALDCGDIDRLGKAFTRLPEPKPPIVNIDHHITNTRFGLVDLVMPEANSTTEILFHLFEAMGVELTTDLAVSLLAGLVTDTLNFSTAGVTADTLKTASVLVEAGADLFTVTMKSLNLKQLSTLLIWQKGLGNMKLEDGLLWTSISSEESNSTGHKGTSSFGLGNMMANVYQAAMSAVLLEMADGRVSVGFRCRPPYSVSELAGSLGGGGHHLAAGCTLDGPLEAAESLVVTRGKASIRLQEEARSNS
jgi:phosphoesterase RecJ-like protein